MLNEKDKSNLSDIFAFLRKNKNSSASEESKESGRNLMKNLISGFESEAKPGKPFELVAREFYREQSDERNAVKEAFSNYLKNDDGISEEDKIKGLREVISSRLEDKEFKKNNLVGTAVCRALMGVVTDYEKEKNFFKEGKNEGVKDEKKQSEKKEITSLDSIIPGAVDVVKNLKEAGVSSDNGASPDRALPPKQQPTNRER